MYPASGTEFAQFETLRVVFLILRGGIIAAFAGRASQRHHNAIFLAFSHNFLRSGLACQYIKIDDDHISGKTVVGAHIQARPRFCAI
jgi:hypothetical protein